MKRITFFLSSLLMIMGGMIVTGCNRSNDWVDLGLPSGLLWATRNVGASSSTDYGTYFAWGETEPKSSYNRDSYRYYEEYGISKYNSKELRNLRPEDDAATANYGGRTPTINEWAELFNNTTPQWTSLDGVFGLRLTGSNGNSIFLPAAGLRRDSDTIRIGTFGRYWSSLLYSIDECRAEVIKFDERGVDFVSGFERSGGMSVRAVRSAR